MTDSCVCCKWKYSISAVADGANFRLAALCMLLKSGLTSENVVHQTYVNTGVIFLCKQLQTQRCWELCYIQKT
jgi:hypothetical protein